MKHFIVISNSFNISRVFSAICAIFLMFFLLFHVVFGAGADELAEAYMTSLLNNKDGYSCSGNHSKATCNAPIVQLDKIERGIKLTNVTLDVALGSKNLSVKLNGGVNFPIDVDFKSPQKRAFLPFLPYKIDCVSKYNLKNIIVSLDDKCSIISPTFNLAIYNLSDLQSDLFRSKNMGDAIQDIIDMFNGINNEDEDIEVTKSTLLSKFNKFKFNHKQLVIDLKGKKLGYFIFKAMKADDSSLTKEIYDSTIDLGVSMVPSYINQVPIITPDTTVSILKATEAVADVITSRKESLKITLKRKSSEPVDLSLLVALFDDDISENTLFSIINGYDITSVSK